MKKFLIKICVFFLVFWAVISGTNYFIDPANIFHNSIVEHMTEILVDGKTIEVTGEFDEGLFQEKMLSAIRYSPETIIIGSSHIMYEEWEFDNYYIAGLSGAYLGDYYAIVGLLDKNNIAPKTILIGVDPWSFMTGADSGRHLSVKNYAKYAKMLVEGREYIPDTTSHGVDLEKVKELFRFAYFQSSVDAIQKYGISKYIHRYEEQILVSQNDDMDINAKITPNGRRIRSFNTVNDVEVNNLAAADVIDNRNIYQLGAGFSEIQYENLEEFEELIEYLQAKDIEIIFYLHSWYPTVYEFFKKDEAYSGVIKLETYIRKMAVKRNIIVHGSYDPGLASITEEDFDDWFHLKPEKMMQCYDFVMR